MRSLSGNLVFAVVLLAAGCSAAVGLENRTLPPDSAKTCQRLCADIGLELSAVAIMADNVGCVCRAIQARDNQSAAVTAGMAAIVLQQIAAAQQQQRNRSTGSSSSAASAPGPAGR